MTASGSVVQRGSWEMCRRGHQVLLEGAYESGMQEELAGDALTTGTESI